MRGEQTKKKKGGLKTLEMILSSGGVHRGTHPEEFSGKRKAGSIPTLYFRLARKQGEKIGTKMEV